MNARPHLHLVQSDTGEVVGETEALILELNKKIAALARENTILKNEQEKAERRSPLDRQIMEVCTFHKRLLSPTWKIVRNKGAYNDVRDRLGDIDAETGRPAFTVLHLRAASVGLSMCEWTRARGIRSAGWLFGSTKHVQWMLDEAISFKRDTATSALLIVDELGRPGLEMLAAKCSHCGRLRIEHEREPDGQGLFDPLCPGFDDFDWEIDVWKRTRDRLAAERALGEDVA